HVRQQLRRLGLEPLAPDSCACPVVTTFAPPGGESSAEFVARCRSWGFSIGGESGYLTERRLVQIATMGAVTLKMVSPLFGHSERGRRRARRRGRATKRAHAPPPEYGGEGRSRQGAPRRAALSPADAAYHPPRVVTPARRTAARPGAGA